MPFGTHWEWRGFGQTEADFRAWFETLPFFYPPTEKPLQDVYLWTPGCVHNIKLRYDALKFKRFIQRRGEFERWREDENEFLPFPLKPAQVRALAQLLAVQLPEIPQQRVGQTKLLHLLAQAHPPVHIVHVSKLRRLARWTPTGQQTPLLLEWTRILQPKSIETVALEHERLDVLQTAHAQLLSQLPHIRPMNYLQAIGRWLK